MLVTVNKCDALGGGGTTGCSHTASHLCTLAEDGIPHLKVVKHDFPDYFTPPPMLIT